MKLITVNIEGSNHLNRIQEFIEKEQPDILCLQEAQPDMKEYLESQLYTAAFLPMTIRAGGADHRKKPEGLILATKHRAIFNSFYYYSPDAALQEFDKNEWRNTCAHGVLHAQIEHLGEKYCIATSHFTWTPNGSEANPEQIMDMASFTKLIRELPPHIMCGDFNIPRKHNRLYAELLKLYKDEIPSHHASSLDKELHRLGKQVDKAIIFEEYMVDYIFTQPPYTVAEVRLEFGVSDHAAAVATILPLTSLTRP